MDLLESESFLSIRNLVSKPVKIVFNEKPEDGINVKVFRRRGRYFIIVADPRPEVGLARGLDTL